MDGRSKRRRAVKLVFFFLDTQMRHASLQGKRDRAVNGALDNGRDERGARNVVVTRDGPEGL